MSDTPKTEKKTSLKANILTLWVVLASINASVGSTGRYRQELLTGEGDQARSDKIAIVLKELKIFAVNLQPEETNQFLQTGLTKKIHDTDIGIIIGMQTPEIRHRIRPLSASKSTSDLFTRVSKQPISSAVVTRSAKRWAQKEWAMT